MLTRIKVATKGFPSRKTSTQPMTWVRITLFKISQSSNFFSIMTTILPTPIAHPTHEFSPSSKSCPSLPSLYSNTFAGQGSCSSIIIPTHSHHSIVPLPRLTCDNHTPTFNLLRQQRTPVTFPRTSIPYALTMCNHRIQSGFVMLDYTIEERL